MAYITLVQLLILCMLSSAFAKADRALDKIYLGEKDLEAYAERYSPLINHDIYQGQLSFQDDKFFKDFFNPYLLPEESRLSTFLKSELNAGMSCPNELLSEHFDSIQFSYRLITLSYLLEGQWHMKMVSDQQGRKSGCDFDIDAWLKSCAPQTTAMNSFISRLKEFSPDYEETLPIKYTKKDWWNDFVKKKFKLYSHYRIQNACGEKCPEQDLEKSFKASCEEDQKLMTQICSEEDSLFGLSNNRDAYSLVGKSNIINTFNSKGEGAGCLRRFSEVMSHKEVRYEVLNNLFPVIQSFLTERYQERFLQGRVFFYGSGKEFEDKGLKKFYVPDQKLKISDIPKMTDDLPVPAAPVVVKAPEVKPTAPVKTKEKPKKEILEIRHTVKSAFLQAAESREAQNLEKVEVDMLKLKYDYVFSLSMMNELSTKLASFMTRDALIEMVAYDKLGSKESPVPLLFLKYMIDMQEHHGLFNLVSVLGSRFYVSNEIDKSFKTKPELIQLVNDETDRQWQFHILKP